MAKKKARKKARRLHAPTGTRRAQAKNGNIYEITVQRVGIAIGSKKHKRAIRRRAGKKTRKTSRKGRRGKK